VLKQPQPAAAMRSKKGSRAAKVSKAGAPARVAGDHGEQRMGQSTTSSEASIMICD